MVWSPGTNGFLLFILYDSCRFGLLILNIKHGSGHQLCRRKGISCPMRRKLLVPAVKLGFQTQPDVFESSPRERARA